MDFSKSLSLLRKVEDVIPVCSQVFSKGPSYFPIGASPLFIQRGVGSHVWDVDNNEYIDYICGLGPITLGYHYPAVDKAIIKQLSKGITFSQPSPLEYELAKLMTQIIPCAEMVRFFKTGSEACQAVARVARAYTGRNHIAFWGYHGWHDWYAASEGCNRQKGTLPIGQFMHQFEYNNLESLDRIFGNWKGQVAAVIMEPMIAVPPDGGFLEGVKNLCQDNGALLIFDETVTGFRWSIGGAQKYFGVIPDLATLGKGMGNGTPIGAVCGRREVMREFEEVMVSSTFGGECLSLAAAIATIKEMQKKDTIGYCWNLGERLCKGLEAIGMPVQGFYCRPALVLKDDPVWKTKLLEQLFARHVMVHVVGLLNLCYSHSMVDIDMTLNAFEDTLKVIDLVELKGKVIQQAFRRV